MSENDPALDRPGPANSLPEVGRRILASDPLHLPGYGPTGARKRKEDTRKPGTVQPTPVRRSPNLGVRPTAPRSNASCETRARYPAPEEERVRKGTWNYPKVIQLTTAQRLKAGNGILSLSEICMIVIDQGRHEWQ